MDCDEICMYGIWYGILSASSIIDQEIAMLLEFYSGQGAGMEAGKSWKD